MMDFFDFTRCVRPNGSAYGTSGKCRKGTEEALSQRVGKGFLAKASIEKLEEYAKRAPYKYQRDAIEAEINRRKGGQRAPSVPPELKQQLAALGGAKPPSENKNLSQKVDKKLLQNATREKLEEYLKRAPYQYQRDKIKAALAERDRRDQQAAPKKSEKIAPSTSTYELNRKLMRIEQERQDALKVNDLGKAGDLLFAKRKIEDELDRRKAAEKGVAKPKTAKEPSAKKEPSKPKPANPALAKMGELELKQRMEAAWKLGKDDKYNEFHDEYAKRIANDPKKKKELEFEDRLRDIQLKRNAAVRKKDDKETRRLEDEYDRVKQEQEKFQQSGRPQGMSKYDHENLVAQDARIVANITADFGKRNYDWDDSLANDNAKLLGNGMYGTATRGANGDVVKRGVIGENEAKMIEKLGETDLGPRLVSGQLDGPGYQPGSHYGRLAMTLVPGSPVGDRDGDEQIGNTGKTVSDAYWEARAKLHRMGVSHNDMHIENVFIDDKGTGRFVDLGMASDYPKSALAEAMGAFVERPGNARGKATSGGTGDGDWQVRQYEGTGGTEMVKAERSTDPKVKKEFARRFPVAGRVLQNKEKAILKMKSYGLTDQDIADIMVHGIRSKPESFERGAMAKLTNQQAMNIIDILYDGI